MQKDRTYRKLKKCTSVMQDRKDFDDEEAMRYALPKRKFLLERIIEYYDLPWEDSEEDEDENAEDEDENTDGEHN